MVITDKETENTSETETKKNRKKRILIGLAVLVGIGIISSIISSMISWKRCRIDTNANSTRD